MAPAPRSPGSARGDRHTRADSMTSAGTWGTCGAAEGSSFAQPGGGDRGDAQVGLEDELLGDKGGYPRTVLSVIS